MHTKRSDEYRITAIVAIALTILTIVEFFIAGYTSSAAILFLLGLIKAALVVYYFMHVARLWSAEGGH
jgi:heme/copper-type cytochrome/quinol oxidase subunit 4